MIQKTTAYNINPATITYMLLRSKSYQPIKAKYDITYNCITVLLACYLLEKSKGKLTTSRIYSFTTYYSYPLLTRHLGKLVSIDLLNLSGKLYSITDKGYQAIELISQTNDSIIYSFCNKYHIEL